MTAASIQIRVRRYPGCAAYFVIAFAPGESPKQRFKAIAAFGKKEKADRLAAQIKKGAGQP